jgi:hypothetical protein
VIDGFHLDRAVSRWLLVVPTCLSVCYMNKIAGLHRVESVDNGGAASAGARTPRPTVPKNMGERDKVQFASSARKVNLAETARPGHATVQCMCVICRQVLTKDHLHLSLPIYIHAPTGASLAVVTQT